MGRKVVEIFGFVLSRHIIKLANFLVFLGLFVT